MAGEPCIDFKGNGVREVRTASSRAPCARVRSCRHHVRPRHRASVDVQRHPSMSGSGAIDHFRSAGRDAHVAHGSGRFEVLVTDQNGNPMAAGTTVAATARKHSAPCSGPGRSYTGRLQRKRSAGDHSRSWQTDHGDAKPSGSDSTVTPRAAHHDGSAQRRCNESIIGGSTLNRSRVTLVTIRSATARLSDAPPRFARTAALGRPCACRL